MRARFQGKHQQGGGGGGVTEGEKQPEEQQQKKGWPQEPSGKNVETDTNGGGRGNLHPKRRDRLEEGKGTEKDTKMHSLSRYCCAGIKSIFQFWILINTSTRGRSSFVALVL